MVEVTFPAAQTGLPYEVEFRGNGYYIGKQRLKRVTTVLQKFPDSGEGLLKWTRLTVASAAGRLLQDRVKKHAVSGKEMVYFPAEQIPSIIMTCAEAPENIKDETADTGTAVHAFNDEWLQAGATEAAYDEIKKNYCLPENPTLLEVLQKQARTDKMSDAERNRFYDQMKAYMFDRFVRFWRTAGLTYVGSEIIVGSRKHGFGGRLDILARDRRGRLVLLDFKTSKWISPAYFAQVAAYKQAYEEQHGEKIHRCSIIQCPREWSEYNMGFGVYPVKTAPYWKIFKFLLDTWEYTEFGAAKCRKEKI